MKIKLQGAWIILHITEKYCDTPYQTWWKRNKTAKPTQCNKKFKKMLHKYGKSQILIARQHFSMALLWRQLHSDFMRFANWTRPFGRHCNFYQVVQAAPVSMRSFDCWEPQLSKKSRVDQESSCSKAGGCRAAQLLGGFLRNLLIVSWVTPTPRCKANFPGNRCSQPPMLPIQ
jgi:hypothetical protein